MRRQRGMVPVQLKTQTDYAIRILLYLAQADSSVVSKELSQSLGINETYLPKITQRLRQVGWVESTCGIRGGFHLLIKPEDISLLDVMRVMEDSIYINRCLEKDGYCSCDAIQICPVCQEYGTFQKGLEEYFASVALDTLLVAQ